MVGTIDACTNQSLGSWSRNCAEQMTRRHDFRTGGVTVAQRHISEITDGRCSFAVSAPKRFGGYGGAQTRLGGTSIQFLKWDSEADCQTTTFRPPDYHVVLHSPLSGQFEAIQSSRRATVKVGQLLVVSSEGTAVRQWHGPCEVLNLVVPRQALSRMLAVDFGLDAARPLKFEPLAVVDLTKIATLTRLVETIISDLNDEMSFFSNPVIAAQAERTLLFLLLKSIPHQHLHLSNEPRAKIAPFYVRRAEAFMREHLDGTVTMDSLTAASGVSARTLYYGFDKYRSRSPMKSLKAMRLGCARKALLDARETGCRVSDVAVRCGYRNFSQFSRDYKEHFGESPAATLRGSAESSLP
ncbi:MAG: helix-turn-helix transcriptional regulator [Xanthobacteraceae bacterium]